jgi:hypothetical protein
MIRLSLFLLACACCWAIMVAVKAPPTQTVYIELPEEPVSTGDMLVVERATADSIFIGYYRADLHETTSNK